MKLERVTIENYRAIENLTLPLDLSLTVFHGDNAHGKTSILSALAVGLGSIPRLLPEVSSIGFLKTDRRQLRSLQVEITTADGVTWRRTMGPQGKRRVVLRELREVIENIVDTDRKEGPPLDLPIVAFYDTDRAVFDPPRRRRGFKTEFTRYAALEGAPFCSDGLQRFLQVVPCQRKRGIEGTEATAGFRFSVERPGCGSSGNHVHDTWSSGAPYGTQPASFHSVSEIKI